MPPKSPLELGCLFCGRTDQTFNSEEHVLPLALGNHEILQPGVVCDRCNNGVLSQLERTFLTFPPVLMYRTINAIESRRGVVPVADFANATMTARGPRSITVDHKGEDVMTPRDEGRYSLTLNLGPVSPVLVAKVARAIYKFTIEMIYLREGPLLAFDPKLNAVKEIVLGSRASRGWLLVQGKTTRPRIGLVGMTANLGRSQNGEEILPVRLQVGGTILATELLVRDPAHAEDPASGGFVLTW